MQNQQQANQNQQNQNANNPFRIGIIVNEGNAADIKFYLTDFKEINRLYGSKVSLVFFGYKPETGILEDLVYEYVPPVSIVHYFKQFASIHINLLFIPLIKSVYNQTSEGYNKYLEAGLFKIPCITINQAPYNELITDQRNGFLYDNKADFIPKLKSLFDHNFQLIKLAGMHAYDDVTVNFNFTEQNARVLSNIFTEHKQS